MPPMQTPTHSHTPTPPLETLIVEAPHQDREWIESVLEALPTTGYACWTPVDANQNRHEAYFHDADDADRAYNALNLQRLAQPEPTTWTLTRCALTETDWANAWKAHFKIEKVSPRIVIRPEWETYTPAESEMVIRIDPGMSFGTGRHETTRSCLRMLDTWTAQGNTGSFLDLGCGSGILAIAAALLGLRPIAALDYDPDAIQGAIENIARNALAAIIQPFIGDVSNLQLHQRYDLVAANILAPLLIEHAHSIAATVNPGGQLILSGILTRQYPDVRATYETLHFQQQETIEDGEWTTGLMVLPEVFLQQE